MPRPPCGVERVKASDWPNTATASGESDLSDPTSDPNQLRDTEFVFAERTPWMF